MGFRLFRLIVATVSTLGIVSCGSSNGLSQVTGKVTYKGQPATGAVVHFQREDGSDSVVPTGIVDDSGEFQLDSLHLGSGALPGKYRVTVRWPEATTPAEARSSPPKTKAEQQARADRLKFGNVPADRLKGRYARPDGLLSAEVMPGITKLPPFELTD